MMCSVGDAGVRKPLIPLPRPSPRKRGEGAIGMAFQISATSFVWGSPQGASLRPACGEKVPAGG
nr:conserved hypothetical protein [Rhizobiaceae bacterium]